MNALQFLDLIFVVVGGIVALILGAPSVGVIVGAGGWILQRAIQVTDRRFTAKLRDPRKQVGIHVSESFGRIWLLAGVIIVAGVAAGRKDGLAAAILIFATYSVGFAVRLASGPPPDREREHR